MATAAEKLAYRKFKAALDATYKVAIEQIAAEGMSSVNWINDTAIREAYYEVWAELSYTNYVKLYGAYDRTLWASKMSGYIQTHLEVRIQEVWAYSRELYVKTVGSAMETAINKGFGVEKTARIIEQDVNSQLNGNINRWRARRIAQTELVGAGNYGTWLAIVQAESEGINISKQWLVHPQGSKTQRHSLMNIDYQIRSPQVPFDVGGEQLQYPGDPSGSAQNIVNCKCVIRPILLDEITIENGKV